ncbi:hypothetical protein SLS55_006755 [Diplodia seriata]|uniref:Uncharacterized protein n=1 Tax=Diplodia seriata TaxID=420778 RepID=A0ABR3CF55_9PEZI
MASNKRPGREFSPRDAQEPKKLKHTSGDGSSKQEASTSTSELVSRPTPKRPNTASGTPSRKSSEDENSVSLPPPRGPAPTAPMMGLSAAAVPTPTRTSSAITPSTATEAATSALTLGTTRRVESLKAILTDIFKFDVQFTQNALKMERLRERHERLLKQASTEASAGNEAHSSALERNLKTVDAEARNIETRLDSRVNDLEEMMLWEVDNYISRRIGEVNDKVQTLEERHSSRDAKLKAILSPLQVAESPSGVISHDGLEAMVRRIVNDQLVAKFKGPLAPIASLPNGSTPKESLAPIRAPKETAPTASTEPQSEMAKVKKDLDVFKQEMYARDKERDTRMEKLEQENAHLKGQVTQLEGTMQKANDKTFALNNALTALTGSKADQNDVSALKVEVTTISGKVDNALSIEQVVTKSRAEVRTVKDELKATVDEVERIKRDMNTTTDPRRRIFQSPATADVNPRVDGIQKRVDELASLINSLPAALEVSNLRLGAEKIKEDIQEIKEAQGKVLDRLDRQEETAERAARDLYSDNTRINEINKDISDLDDTLDSLKRKVRDIDTDLDNLEQEVEQLPHANFDGSGKTEGDFKTKTAEITKIQEKLLRHEKEIKSLDSKTSGKSTPDNSEAITRRLDSLEAKQGAQQDSISTTTQNVEALQKTTVDVKAHKNAMDDIERKFEQRHAALAKPVGEIQTRLDTIEQQHSSLHDKVNSIDDKLENADTESQRRDEVQRRFDAIESEQSSMHDKIGNIEVKVETGKKFDDGVLKYVNDHAKSIKRLDRILRGDEPTDSEVALPRGMGLIQQLADLETVMQAGKLSNRRQSTGNPAPAQQPDTVLQAAVGMLERRFTLVERDHAKLNKAIDELRIDFGGFEESIAEQSELIEADVKRQVKDQVALALASAKPPTQPTSTTDAVEHRMDDLASRIRNEMQDLHRDTAGLNVKEIEDAVFSKLERTASRIVTEKLDAANQRLEAFDGRLLTVSASVTRFEQNYPNVCSETLADILSFSRPYGKLSDFLKAALEAIRNLQGRFDNMLTHQLANHISNQLMPHITHKLVGPIRDAVAPIINSEMRQNHKQLSDKQELLDMRFNDLEQKVNTTGDAAWQDDLRKQSEEFLRSCATINERVDKGSRTTDEALQKLWAVADALKTDFDSDKALIWEYLKEHRENIERAQDDFGSIQACVVRIAKETNPLLVPNDWLDLA